MICAAIACLIGFSATAARSQVVSGTSVGTVTDASGAVVPNAKVTAIETQTSLAHNTQTNESGNYSVPNLAPGLYSVSVEAAGFKKETRRDVNLLLDTVTRVDVQLQPGNLTETVEVSADTAILQTYTASTTEKIDRQVLANVPLIGSNRNYQTLLNPLAVGLEFMPLCKKTGRVVYPFWEKQIR